MQWSLDYSPQQGHPVGYGTATDESCTGTPTGGCLSYLERNIDFHHMMFANISHRIPENSNFSTSWTNVIIYNWDSYANQFLGGGQYDVVNSKFIQGPNNASAMPHPIHFTQNSPEMCGNPSVYVAGNIYGAAGFNTVASDQYGTLAVVTNGEEAQSETDSSPALCPQAQNMPGVPVPSGWKRSGPMASSNAFPIVPDPATQLDTILLPQVGNSQHLTVNAQGVSTWVTHRDAQDNAVISAYQNGGAGGYWPNGVTYDGVYYLYNAQYAPGLPMTCPSGDTCLQFPTLQSAYTDTPPASGTPCVSSLHDGMCDAWKAHYGLSTTDTGLYKRNDPVWGNIPYLEVEQAGDVP
jgi:hypothetical protein